VVKQILQKGHITAARGRFNAFASPCLILWRSKH